MLFHQILGVAFFQFAWSLGSFFHFPTIFLKIWWNVVVYYGTGSYPAGTERNIQFPRGIHVSNVYST